MDQIETLDAIRPTSASRSAAFAQPADKQTVHPRKSRRCHQGQWPPTAGKSSKFLIHLTNIGEKESGSI
ncbi:MAG: hypothetical protein ACU841_08960 [Gammaproteobacteria bacterium]